MGIYGGNEFAMKAANHELKGLQAYVNCNIENLYFPLFGLTVITKNIQMNLIDFTSQVRKMQGKHSMMILQSSAKK